MSYDYFVTNTKIKLFLATLNSACSPNRQCVEGAQCVSNTCKCAPLYQPSGNACIYTAPKAFPAPIFGVPSNPIAPAAPVPFPAAPALPSFPFQPVAPSPAFPSIVAPSPGFLNGHLAGKYQNLYGAPFSKPNFWHEHFGGFGSPYLEASFIQAPGPLPVSGPNLAVPFIQAPGPSPVSGRVLPPVAPVISWPGDSCSNGHLCAGNSICQRGLCDCAVNYALSGNTCIENPALPAPAPIFPAPAPFVPAPGFNFPKPIPGPSANIPPYLAYSRAFQLPFSYPYFPHKPHPGIEPASHVVPRINFPQPAPITRPLIQPGVNPYNAPCAVEVPDCDPIGPNLAFANLLANPGAAAYPFPFAPFTSKKGSSRSRKTKSYIDLIKISFQTN